MSGLEEKISIEPAKTPQDQSYNGFQAVLIAGPTASGKSALALRIAQASNGYIINTDSMQIYQVLDQLTARPQSSDLHLAPHYLYGHISPDLPYSTGRWLEEVTTILEKPELRGRLPVFVGGTGLYFKALLGGLSQMPSIPANIRESWRSRMEQEGSVKLHQILSDTDPEMAFRLNAGDSQRIVRALEVMDATGRSLSYWQQQKGTALFDQEKVEKLILAPDRQWLRDRIAQRFRMMMEGNAESEVQALLALKLDPTLPAMKAIGVREIEAYLNGAISQNDAIERAIIATHQYAKRQMTWFRNQFGDDWKRLNRAEDYCT